MYRYKIVIEYNGCDFHGWQNQNNKITIQKQIEIALTKFTKQTPRLNGAGRTDAGVHALGQVAHFDLNIQWDVKKINGALNYHLKPYLISIISVELVNDKFNARFDAKQRHYIYKIINRYSPLTVDKGLAWHVQRPLNIKNMQKASKYLEGCHDFTTFRSVHCQSKSPIKTINNINIVANNQNIQIKISAKSFMHNQVRSFVGSLKNVGEGYWESIDIKYALDSCNRHNCGQVAPAMGLYLVKIDY